MVRLAALFAGALAAGCTLVVNEELASCPDLIFLDGTPNNGGLRFHGGVSAPSFRGPAFPPPGQAIDNYGSTLTFLSAGTVEQVGGAVGDGVFMRAQNYSATSASSTPGHVGPGGFGCAEVVAATYDTLHDRTSLQLLASGCGEDAAFDGGTLPGAPEPLAPAVAWAPSADGGGMIASVLGSQAQACPESFPPTCFPPQGGAVPAGGARRMDSLLDAQGQPVWIVPTEGADTRLYSSDFAGSIAAVSWAGPVAAVGADVGIVMRIQAGELDAQLFDSTGAPRGPEAHTPLNDAAARGLEIARLALTPVLRIAWIGGDGKAHAAQYDASVATAQRLGSISTVCGSAGASFVAPTSTTTAAVVVGDSLFLRRVQ
ncbi:MAG: hypothetical protein ABR567_15600 [Myxococcales bacterium]